MNQYCSVFSQLLQLFPRLEFQQMVDETKSESHARGFSSWSQFVSMLFCQLGRAHSLREISVVDDRGYNDYELFGRWTAQGVYFVIRMKENALFKVVGEKKVPQNRHILKPNSTGLFRIWSLYYG